MDAEIRLLTEQIKDAYEGDPWFGRPATSLLAEVTEEMALERPNGQHSILELVWHMVNWREFTINRLQPDAGTDVQYFEQNDWRELDHTDKSLLAKGLEQLAKTQEQLLQMLPSCNSELLNQNVGGRTYSFCKLLHGILQHDIYHLGQIAYLVKLLKNK